MTKIWKPKQSLRDNLHRSLPGLVAEYFEAGRSAMAPDTTWEAMHAFRLLTKRFRYTMEVFRQAYGPAMDARIESLRKLQTFLGDINDCVVTSSMLTNVPDTELIREELKRKADRKTANLRQFWARSFDAPGQCERWRAYVGRYACRPKRQQRPRSQAAPHT